MCSIKARAGTSVRYLVAYVNTTTVLAPNDHEWGLGLQAARLRKGLCVRACMRVCAKRIVVVACARRAFTAVRQVVECAGFLERFGQVQLAKMIRV